jgi:hypothetical protein
MIFTKQVIAIVIFLLIGNYAVAANIDFETLNHNESNTNYTKYDCTSAGQIDAKCYCSEKELLEGKTFPCIDKKTEIEPKFSTKRPRGQ